MSVSIGDHCATMLSKTGEEMDSGFFAAGALNDIGRFSAPEESKERMMAEAKP
jgi:hypothetical protein